MSFSPSELNDIDSEDEEDTTKDYDSDEDLQVGIFFARVTGMTIQWKSYSQWQKFVNLSK